MKVEIHPTYHTNVKVTCACGNSFVTGSTTESIHVEICANCHPFFTGQGKILDIAGRVDKFKARVDAARDSQKKRPVKKPRGTLVPAEVSKDQVAKQKEQSDEK